MVPKQTMMLVLRLPLVRNSDTLHEAVNHNPTQACAISPNRCLLRPFVTYASSSVHVYPFVCAQVASLHGHISELGQQKSDEAKDEKDASADSAAGVAAVPAPVDATIGADHEQFVKMSRQAAVSCQCFSTCNHHRCRQVPPILPASCTPLQRS